MSKANPYVAPVYFIVFAVSFYLILLNMFIAIMSVYYEETMLETEKDDKNGEDFSTIQLIKNEIQRKYTEISEKILSETKNSDPQLVYSNLPLSYKIFAKFVRYKFTVQIPEYPDENKEPQAEIIQTEQNLIESPKPIEKLEISENNEENLKPKFILDFLNQQEKCNKIYRGNSVYDLEYEKPIFWLSALENCVSNENIRFEKKLLKAKLANIIRNPSPPTLQIEFYPLKNLDDLDPEVKDFVLSDKNSKMQVTKWENATPFVKYKFWCGLDAEYSEYFYNFNNLEPIKEEEKSENSENSSKSPSFSNKSNSSKNLDISINSNLESQIQSKNVKILRPQNTNITLKAMFHSPEFCSNYAKMCSDLQWQYWKMLNDNEKIRIWVLYFNGKQRAKLWGKMKFSKIAIKEFSGKSIKYFDLWNENENFDKNEINIEGEKEFRINISSKDQIYKNILKFVNCIFFDWKK